MDITDVIKKRRSIRKFTNEKIDEEMLENILTYSLLAPS
ncbi:MAG: nitroreductase family protein, partial [Fervidobacterium sp.]